jgi:arylsulfatase A-like enzyme/Tfp pilus assembly protein PilF
MARPDEDGTQRTQSKKQKTVLAASAGVALIVVASTGWLIWRRAAVPAPQSGACSGCNVLLITIDTLRADRVDAFGGTRQLTPVLDSLASEGLRLTRTYASAPLTLPSHASIMTAASPPIHGVRNNSLFRLGDRLPTLASVLKSAGYRTGAFVGAFVLDARFGLNRGFEVYDDRYGENRPGDPAEGAERRGEDVVKPAIAWITNPQSQSTPSNPQSQSTRSNPQSNPQPVIRNPQWFAWVHLYDPHEPYRAPQPYASRYEPYDAEVAYTDAMVGRLVDALRAAGELDRTLVVVAADHGESLGEHGELTHGVFVYESTMRVPAFLWAGSRIGQRAYDGVTRLIDLAPTMLDLLGVSAPATFEGQSLLPAVNAPRSGRPPVYVEAMDANLTRNWAPLTGLVAGGYKLIDLPVPELYDLGADPGETTNLFSHDSERARTLEALLRDRVAQLAAQSAAPAHVTLDAGARQRLQSLGYVASAAAPGARVYTEADDPKRLIAAADQLNRVLAAFTGGAGEAAMAGAREIMRAHPSFTTAFGVYASMQRDTGDLAGAIATLEDTVRRNIADQSVMVVLAGYLQESGAFDRAASLLEAVVGSHPDYADAYNSLGVVYSRLGRHADAQAAYRKVIELDPTSAKAYENIGIDALSAGNLAAAGDALGRALSLDPALAGAHNALAAVHMRQGRLDDATAEWKAALDINPRLFDALYNLGTTLYRAGQRDDARPYIQRFVDEAPPARYAADIAKLRPLLAR